MKHVVILQARMSSTRLPGKVLLPVAGYASVSLAALRAANTGSQVLVATSIDSSDDALVAELAVRGIAVFRGPLDDVLARYFQAVANLQNDVAVVRLTADNLVPDGNFVQELATAFATSGADYLTPPFPESGLPYGMGAEVFSVRALRKAHAEATSVFDREHVGPWIARTCRSSTCAPQALRGRDLSHLRCTIDDEEDYERMRRLFEGFPDPLTTNWLELIEKLSGLPGEPAFRIPWRKSGGKLQSEMTLGTAQLGMAYGIVNRTGKPSREAAVTLTRHAIAHGVRSVDTARAYGESEDVLQEALAGAWRSRVEVITKLDPLTTLPREASRAQVFAAIDASVRSSCTALGVQALQTLLLHRWSHRVEWEGAAWQRLLELRDSGRIAVLGASVYHPEDALQALRDPDVRHIQLPFNILDHRWRERGILEAAAQRPDVIIHARSALLQGLLASDVKAWPDTCGYDLARAMCELRGSSKRMGRESVVDLCLAYVRSQDWVSSVVVGCETLEQVCENLAFFRLPKLTDDQCRELEDSLQPAPEDLLNPSRWKLPHESSKP